MGEIHRWSPSGRAFLSCGESPLAVAAAQVPSLSPALLSDDPWKCDLHGCHSKWARTSLHHHQLVTVHVLLELPIHLQQHLSTRLSRIACFQCPHLLCLFCIPRVKSLIGTSRKPPVSPKRPFHICTLGVFLPWSCCDLCSVWRRFSKEHLC